MTFERSGFNEVAAESTVGVDGLPGCSARVGDDILESMPGPRSTSAEFLLDGHAHAHPDLASFAPACADAGYIALREDIRRHGQRQPIVVVTNVDDTLIVDGVQRYRACCELRIACRAQEWDGQVPLREVCWSLNLQRRHLSPSQLAVFALAKLPEHEAEAKARQAEGRRRGGEAAGRGRRRNSSSEVLPSTNRARATDQAAAEVGGVSGKLVAAANFVAKNAPQLLPLVGRGELRLELAKPLARQLHKLPSEQDRRAALERGQAIGFRALKNELSRHAAKPLGDDQILLRALRAAEKLRVDLAPVAKHDPARESSAVTAAGRQRLVELLRGFGDAAAALNRAFEPKHAGS